MRNLSKWLLGAVLALLLTALLALALAVEGAPRVPHRDEVSAADVDRAVALLRYHDPRRAPLGQLRSLSLSERDIDLLVHHAARRWLEADTRIRLQPGRLFLQASVAGPRGRWLNIELVLRQAAILPAVDSLRVGRLPVPSLLAMPLLRAFAARQGVQADALLLAVDWIERVTLAPGRMVVRYRIDPDTVSRLRAALVAPADQQRLRAYNERLALLTRGVEGQARSVAAVLPPLFALAAERSADGGDAVAENRAALLTLTFFANDRPLGLVVPAAYHWPRPQHLTLTLRQRQDFALHFLISAVIAAEAGTPLADAVGLWKELADARRGGSGFSFNDLAADRAGTRFGELAVRDPVRLQARIAAGVGDVDLMPEPGDLPQHLPQAEFIARYGGVGGAGYSRMLAEIEARIDALPLFR
ncbi:MAG TPA: hypothetical protein VET87_13850 [Rubrivivax sp.]|nr:hypothetical protein [Rubrivivax sp.]